MRGFGTQCRKTDNQFEAETRHFAAKTEYHFRQIDLLEDGFCQNVVLLKSVLFSLLSLNLPLEQWKAI